MKEVIDGFLKFQKDAFPRRSTLFRDLATRQNPRALFISCSDSRLVPELVTQREPGDLFVIRNAGNIVPSYGPEPGGVTASCTCLDHMPAVASWLRYADSARVVNDSRPHPDQPAKVAAMVRENVIAQLANIQTHPSVRLALEEGRLTLHGWVYDIGSGRIDAFNGQDRTFVSLADNPSVHAVSRQTRRVA